MGSASAQRPAHCRCHAPCASQTKPSHTHWECCQLPSYWLLFLSAHEPHECLPHAIVVIHSVAMCGRFGGIVALHIAKVFATHTGDREPKSACHNTFARPHCDKLKRPKGVPRILTPLGLHTSNCVPPRFHALVFPVWSWILAPTNSCSLHCQPMSDLDHGRQCNCGTCPRV